MEPVTKDWPSFDLWWIRLKRLGKEQGFTVRGEQDEYYEYYCDGDLPEDTLDEIQRHRK